MKKLLILTLLLCISCNDKKPETKPVVKPTPMNTSYKFKWKHEYNDYFLINAIKTYGAALLTKKPSDWKDYIDVYPTTQDGLITFWGNIMVEMALWESNWDSSISSLEEDYFKRTGIKIFSRGLFQMSIESARAYKKCKPLLASVADLHVDSKNIKCAVIILNHLFDKDGVITKKVRGGFLNTKTYWRGGARYWAVLRGTKTYTKKALKAIKGANR
ncbi:hypothetical protein KAR91_40915 [Candidatus Pacearchaeota archaeon]|nr:hypothetical protein [Candidatus Pacearchaeota archaeon]